MYRIVSYRNGTALAIVLLGRRAIKKTAHYLAICDGLLFFHFERVPLDVFHLDGVRHLLGRQFGGQDGRRLFRGRFGCCLHRQCALSNCLTRRVLGDTPEPPLCNSSTVFKLQTRSELLLFCLPTQYIAREREKKTNNTK